MKGFPPGPSVPLNQLNAAPLEGAASAPLPTVDPFAGMDLPQLMGGNEEGATAVVEEAEEISDFSAPQSVVRAESAVTRPERSVERPREPERQVEPERQAVPERQAEPERRAVPERKAVSEPAPAATKQPFVPAKPKAGSGVSSLTKQLELRAIFGVAHELSAQEILQKARALPGILQVAKANAKETAAFETLQGCAARLGLDEGEPIVMSCPDGFIDFLTYDETSLAILRNEDYKPGVRETLLIVARELGRL